MTARPMPGSLLAELDRLRPTVPALDAIRQRATQRGHQFRICRVYRDTLEPPTDRLPALPVR